MKNKARKAKKPDIWNPEEAIIRIVTKGQRVIKVHERYLPLILALLCRGLIRIVNRSEGLIEIAPPDEAFTGN